MRKRKKLQGEVVFLLLSLGTTPQLWSWQLRPAPRSQPTCLQATPRPHWDGCISAPRGAPARTNCPRGDDAGQESGGSSISWRGCPGPGEPFWEETGSHGLWGSRKGSSHSQVWRHGWAYLPRVTTLFPERKKCCHLSQSTRSLGRAQIQRG